MNLDQQCAFAITEDHERQERVWKDYRPSTAAHAAAALAHYFFASRIGEQQDQRMAARVADRLCRIGSGELRFWAFSSTQRLRDRMSRQHLSVQL